MVQPMANMLLTRNAIDSYDAVVRRAVPFSPHSFKMFKRGLVDVHFSERGRQGRLFVFAWQTRTKWSFGIDENTGIIEFDDGNLRVMGQNGVVIYDMENANLENGTMHYLTEGDVLTTSGEILYPNWKLPCESPQIPRNSTNIFTQFKLISLDVARYNRRIKHTGIVGRNPVVQVTFEKLSNSRTMCGIFNGTSYVSFSHMSVSMTARTAQEVGKVGDEVVNMEPYYIDD